MNPAKLYVGNFPYAVTETELREFFAAAGVAIGKITLVLDKETKKPKGFGFIELLNKTCAEVISSFDGVDFGGRTLRVREAIDKPKNLRGTNSSRGGAGAQQRGGMDPTVDDPTLYRSKETDLLSTPDEEYAKAWQPPTLAHARRR